jgi:hypothetical protein
MGSVTTIEVREVVAKPDEHGHYTLTVPGLGWHLVEVEHRLGLEDGYARVFLVARSFA